MGRCCHADVMPLLFGQSPVKFNKALLQSEMLASAVVLSLWLVVVLQLQAAK